MKKQTKSKKKNQQARQYFIPMTKNQLQRSHFQTSVNEWVLKKFDFGQKLPGAQIQKKEELSPQFKKKCKEIQAEFLLKHKIQGLIFQLPLEYYETLIQYVMQKKLYWTFKMQESPQISSQIPHKNMEIQLVLELKKHYKNYEYSQNTLPQLRENSSKKRQSFNPNRTMVQKSSKKSNFDFVYELLLMFSVCVVASFFQDFFPELEIDRIFRSQIYIIINHAFLDLEVSPNVYDVMEKKFYANLNKKQFQSLNTSYTHEFPMSHQRVLSKQALNPDSKRTLANEKTKSKATIENSTLNKIVRSQSKERQAKNLNPNGQNNFSSKGLSSIGFSNFNSGANSKKDLTVKQAMSIGYSLPSERQNTSRPDLRSHQNVHLSRFNSFLKDTKQMNVPQTLEETLDTDHLITDEEVQFYSTIKNCLYVQALPPIIKKKMNINQYQKLNEVDRMMEIKKEIKEIDQNSKKHNFKSNELSLAMNTFISTQFDFVKKKRHQRNVQIVTEYLKGSKPKLTEDSTKEQNRKSFSSQEKKENFEMKKLPFKASTLKFQPHKSCNFYAFNDQILKIGEVSQKQMNLPKSDSIFSSQKVKELDNFDKLTQRERTKPNQVIQKQFREAFKPLQETISLRDSEKKRNLGKKAYVRKRQSELNPYGSSEIIDSIGSFKNADSHKIIPAVKKRVSHNPLYHIENKQIDQRESILNNNNLSSKLQKFETGTREITQIELINQHSNRTEDLCKFGTLESEVNVHKDNTPNYKNLYKSFELKKKLRNFETHCKKRQDISNYSMFNIKNYNDTSNYSGMMV